MYSFLRDKGKALEYALNSKIQTELNRKEFVKSAGLLLNSDAADLAEFESQTANLLKAFSEIEQDGDFEFTRNIEIPSESVEDFIKKIQEHFNEEDLEEKLVSWMTGTLKKGAKKSR